MQSEFQTQNPLTLTLSRRERGPDTRPAVVRQTLAILHDAYRELNSKRMFWITMILSGLAMGVFAVVSISDNGLQLAGYRMEMGIIPPQSLYKWLFSTVMIGWWLTWAATILAIVSVGSIFPDFLSGGSIDLYISKPISRLRLFFTKYLAGMLFVLLQVSIFAIIAFFVIGFRGHMWEPGLFLAIPIVLCFFSYLFCLNVLFALLTRSAISALLLTILCWAMIFGVHFAEIRLIAISRINQRRVDIINRELARMDALAATTQPSIKLPFGLKAQNPLLVRVNNSPFRAKLVAKRDQNLDNVRTLSVWHKFIYPVKLLGPKTTETIDLLDRELLSKDEFLDLMNSIRDNSPHRRANDLLGENDMMFLDDEIDAVKRSRSTAWVIGTSLGFEAVVLGISAWIFCRRDF
jgi:ABC-type transport system involved in multi-copper enzyme maturation permease subunit